MTTKSSIRDQLLTVFPVNQADVLATVVVEAQDWLATKGDVHELRTAITELADAQKRTEVKVEELAEAQKQTEVKVGELADALTGTQKLVGELVASHKLLCAQGESLAEAQGKMLIRVDRADGRALEWSLQTRLPAYAGRWIKRCRVLQIQEVVESLEPLVSTGVYTEADLDQLSYTDIVASGVLDGEKVYIVGEVSCTGDREDIERAAGRAALLSKAGTRALPFISCDTISSTTVEQAKSAGVRILLGSRLLPA